MGWRDDPLSSDAPVAEATAPASRAQFAETPGGAVTGLRPSRLDAAINALRGARSVPEPTFQEAWRSDPVVEPELSSKVGALGQGATGGFLETAPTVAGAVTGFKLGAPLGPWGMAGGTVLGGLSGALAGKTLREHASRVPLGDGTLTTPSVQDMPPELRPYGYAGEVVGAGGPIAALPLAAGASRLPEFTGARATPFVNRILDSAQRTPGTFAASEAAGLGGAGVAGGATEFYRPGETAPRIGAEIAGGLFNPTRIFVGAARGIVDSSKAALTTMTKAGRENKAATVLQDIVTKFGEDPATLAKALRESGLPGVNVTSAQKSGSPALIALEARLAQESSKFGADSKRMADESLSAIRNMIVALEGTGSPDALKAAAEMRSQYFRALIYGRIQLAERQATESASRITQDTTQVRTELAKGANEALATALSESRGVERSLWEKVPKDIPAFPENILAKHSEMRSQMLPEEGMPAVIEGFVQRMTKGGGGVVGPRGEALGAGETTSGELLLLRSRALLFAREAEAKGAFNEARIYGTIAEAALDDLSGISASVPEIGAARLFSRELHDTFTRTFAGEALSAKSGGGGRATGAERIPPELLMRRAFGAGREAGALRFKQLEEAVSFLPKKGLGGPDAQQNLDFMLNAQERVLRLSASEAIDPTTGRVSPIRLARFISDHTELLERFPDVRKTLQTALKSETGLRDIERMAEGASKLIEKKTAFARIGKFDSPADAVRNALSGNTPAKDFMALTNLAKRGGSDAVEGLRYSVWEDAIRRSTADTGEMSFYRLQKNLFEPVRPGQPSLVQMLKAQGVMTASDLSRADELVKRAIRIEESVQRGGTPHDLTQNPDAAFDLFVRIAGAKAGTAIAGIGGQATAGHTLIAAGRGSTYARSVLEKIPQGRVNDVLVEAATNPQFAVMLLSKPKSQAEGIRLARQIHAYLLQAGITGDEPEGRPGERIQPGARR